MIRNYCYCRKQATVLLLAALILSPSLSSAAEPIPGDGVPEGYMMIEGDIIVPENFYEMQGKLFCWDELEVIGNIWENPELVKEVD